MQTNLADRVVFRESPGHELRLRALSAEEGGEGGLLLEIARPYLPGEGPSDGAERCLGIELRVSELLHLCSLFKMDETKFKVRRRYADGTQLALSIFPGGPNDKFPAGCFVWAITKREPGMPSWGGQTRLTGNASDKVFALLEGPLLGQSQ